MPEVLEKEMEAMEEAVQLAANPSEVEAIGETDYLMPTLVEEFPMVQAPVIDFSDIKQEEEPVIIHFELQPQQDEPVSKAEEKLLSTITVEQAGASTVSKMSTVGKNDSIISMPQTIKEKDAELIGSIKDSTSTTPVSAASGGYLARPSNIYAESKPGVVTPMTSAEKPVLPSTASNEEEELLDLQMQIVEKDDIQAADMPLAHQAQTPLFPEVEDSAMQDETEEQKRRAAERLHKLRNLSFNVNAADPNNEFETVPAYIRRNMELYNSNSQVENFYSSYEVKTDQNNQTQISTINTFLDGKKPD